MESKISKSVPDILDVPDGYYQSKYLRNKLSRAQQKRVVTLDEDDANILQDALSWRDSPSYSPGTFKDKASLINNPKPNDLEMRTISR